MLDITDIQEEANESDSMSQAPQDPLSVSRITRRQMLKRILRIRFRVHAGSQMGKAGEIPQLKPELCDPAILLLGIYTK